jgi:hypothetical protein
MNLRHHLQLIKLDIARHMRQNTEFIFHHLISILENS